MYTVDTNNSIAEAMAIAGGKIVEIGTNNVIEQKYNAIRIVDLGGKTVLPGLIDSHCHFLVLGLTMSTLICRCLSMDGTHQKK